MRTQEVSLEISPQILLFFLPGLLSAYYAAQLGVSQAGLMGLI